MHEAPGIGPYALQDAAVCMAAALEGLHLMQLGWKCHQWWPLPHNVLLQQQ